jgi:hypothetical protein
VVFRDVLERWMVHFREGGTFFGERLFNLFGCRSIIILVHILILLIVYSFTTFPPAHLPLRSLRTRPRMPMPTSTDIKPPPPPPQRISNPTSTKSKPHFTYRVNDIWRHRGALVRVFTGGPVLAVGGGRVGLSREPNEARGGGC